MLSLVRKDLRVTFRFMAIVIPVFAVSALVGLVVARTFLILSFAMAASLIAMPVAIDWSAGAGAFVHSLPVSRSVTVKARYATAALLGGGCFLVGALMATCFGALVQRVTGVWPDWIGVHTAIAFVASVGVFAAALLGVAFRFGEGAAGVAGGGVAVVIAPLLLRGTGQAWSAAFVDSMGPAIAALVTGSVVGLLGWVSMRWSIHANEHREF